MSALPKPVAEAIENYESISHQWRISSGLRSELDASRAALEAAIEAHVAERVREAQAPPTDAEVEAWEKDATQDSIDSGFVKSYPQLAGTECEGFMLTREKIDEAVALMRRAAPLVLALARECRRVLDGETPTMRDLEAALRALETGHA